MVQFGDRLRELRLSRQITQKELGRMFQLSESAIGMYERNQREPSLELIRQFADFFQVTTGYMLDHEEPAPGVRELPTLYPLPENFHMLLTEGRRIPLSENEALYLRERLHDYRQRK